jgi:protein-S-isoprenylcysteine O-methyltransferase Ste14
MKKRLKINGVIIFFVVLLIAAFPAIFLRKEQMVFWDEIAEIFGIAFILLGQIFRVSARGYKSEYSPKGNVLIQDGPYAVSRNPMYLGILLIGLGIVLALFNWWVVIIFLFVFITRYILLIFKEEKKLLIIFPNAYQDYCKTVPRILPSLDMVLNTDIREYLPLKFSWLKKEIGSILAVLLITLFLESWEDIRNRGIKLYFKEAIWIMITVMFFIILIIYLIKTTARLKKDVSNKS